MRWDRLGTTILTVPNRPLTPPSLISDFYPFSLFISLVFFCSRPFYSRVARFPAACKTEAKWMFGHLDLNNDGFLSTQEMYDLEHDQNERCIKPFLDTCDLDQDNTITPREWCRCFEKTDRPCTAVRRRIGNDLLGKLRFFFVSK